MPYQLKDGRWRGHRMIDGKRKTKILKTKKEAIQWETRQDKEWDLIPTVSLGEWATAYLDMARERFTPQTYQEKRTVFRMFFQVVDKTTGFDEMTIKQAHKYLGQQARTRSGHAANKDRKNLKAAWVWGVRYMGLPEKNPFSMVDPYPEEKNPRYLPPVEDMDKILANETGEVRTFLLTLLHTAARRGELLRLKWGDIDFERQTIRLATRKRKGGSLEYDTIPMTAALKRKLVEHKAKARSVFVFCNQEGKPFTERRWLMHRVCRRNGVKHFGFHAIRHLAASMMDREGVPVATIQAILRHKARTTTDRYLHQLRGVRADLDGVFEDKAKIVNLHTNLHTKK